jgi:hypothetical protein
VARFEALVSANIATAASGDTSVVAAPGAGLRIRVHSYRLVGGNGATANTAKWTDGAAGTVKETLDVLANTGSAPSTNRPDYLFQCSPNTALVLNLSAAQRVTGGVSYSIERTTGIVE